ncbi:MAG: GldG family protein [Clostridia bacterium]|nr:GldG family protein [Clostridia bacterium]
MKNNEFLRSRRFRYGGVAVVFTCVLVAAVLLLNAVFSVLADKFLWYTDLTSESIYTLSDSAVKSIESIDKDVDIIFCDDPDNLMQEYYQRLVYETALGLEKNNPYVHVSTVNIWRNPTAVSKFKTDSKSKIYSTSIIVSSGSEFRVYTIKSMFTFDDSTSTTPWAYSGEKKLCSGILAVTQAVSPIACITANHGEPFSTESDLAASAGLLDLLYDAGYKIQLINLVTEDIPADCRMLVVYDPQDDFLVKDGVSQISEIEKIDKYLDSTNSIMVFLDNDTPKLRNLEEYLEEWGIRFDRHTDANDTVYSTTVKDSGHSLTQDGMTVVGAYTSHGLGASLHSDLRTTYPPKVIFPYAMGLSYTYENIYHEDEKDSSNNYWYGYKYANGVSRSIYDVFNAYPGAVEMANGAEVGESTQIAPIHLMTVSSEPHIIKQGSSYAEGNTTDYSYVLACGSTEFLSGTLLNSNTYGNGDLMLNAMRSMGKEVVPVGLTLKPFSSTEIENITTREANGYTIALVVTPAVLTLGFAVFFLVRRKYA